MQLHGRRLKRALRPLVFASGAALIATSIVIVFEVVIRRLFGSSLTGADEIAGYALAGVTAWGFAYATAVKAHIRIDTLIQFLPQPQRAFLDLLANLSLLIFAGALAYHAYEVLSFSLERGSRSQTPLRVPLWIPQMIWAAGLAFFCAVCAALTTMVFLRLVRGDWTGATDLLNAEVTGSHEADTRHKAEDGS